MGFHVSLLSLLLEDKKVYHVAWKVFRAGLLNCHFCCDLDGPDCSHVGPCGSCWQGSFFSEPPFVEIYRVKGNSEALEMKSMMQVLSLSRVSTWALLLLFSGK